MLLAFDVLLSPPVHRGLHTPVLLPSREGHGCRISARISVHEYFPASETLGQLVARLSNCL